MIYKSHVYFSVLPAFLIMASCSTSDKPKFTHFGDGAKERREDTPRQTRIPSATLPVVPVESASSICPQGSSLSEGGIIGASVVPNNQDADVSSYLPLTVGINDQHGFDEYNQHFLRNEAQSRPTYNDAKIYGVSISYADVPAGQIYWKIIGVHHLTPKENRGKHNLMVEILNESGSKIRGGDYYFQKINVPMPSNNMAIKMDKPINEPFGNVDMYKNDRIDTYILGQNPAGSMLSDRVTGITTRHPDERSTDDREAVSEMFHHSFYVVFQRTTKSENPVQVAAVTGIVKLSSRETLMNWFQFKRTDGQEATLFANVLPGQYAEKVLPLGKYSLWTTNGQNALLSFELSANNNKVEIQILKCSPSL